MTSIPAWDADAIHTSTTYLLKSKYSTGEFFPNLGSDRGGWMETYICMLIFDQV